jgi:outer membrane immunogenic protein
MIRKTGLALASAAAIVAAQPAFAQAVPGEFTGARVGVELGVVDDDFLGTDEVTYGVVAGYDFDFQGLVAGVHGSYTGLFDDDGADLRDLTVGGRLGTKLTPRTLLYGSAAYTNLDADGFAGSLDGAKFGVGLEQSYGNVYGNVETRYANYEAGVELYQTVIGVGLRF